MELAARDGRVIVNADALQVYANWRILTARPSTMDESALPHALYGHVGRDQPYSVGHWLREVQSVLAEGQRPIIVGGTGMYLTALVHGLAPVPAIDEQVRAAVRALDTASAHTALEREDPGAAADRCRLKEKASHKKSINSRYIIDFFDGTPEP